MQYVDLKINGDGAWPELEDREVIDLPNEKIHVCFLDNGTLQGSPVVGIRSDDGNKSYILQFTGKQFQAIAAALRGKYGVIDG